VRLLVERYIDGIRNGRDFRIVGLNLAPGGL